MIISGYIGFCNIWGLQRDFVAILGVCGGSENLSGKWKLGVYWDIQGSRV